MTTLSLSSRNRIETPAHESQRCMGAPGLIMAYALLLSVAGGVAALGGILLVRSGDMDAANTILLVAGGGLYMALARGLWLMRSWSRVIILIFQGLNILVQGATCIADPASGGGIKFGLLLGIWISSVLVQWCSLHGRPLR